MIIKPSYYNDFHCIGGDCSFTCCMDWDINLDRDETNRYLMVDGYRNEKPLKLRGDGTAQIRFNENGVCAFLNEKGLCRLVLEHGEEFISHICHIFPRFETHYGNVTEMHLSNGCAAVLDFFLKLESPLTFIAEDDGRDDAGSTPDGVIFRDRCIDLLQISEMPLYCRLYILQKIAGEYSATGDKKLAQNRPIDADFITSTYAALLGVEIPPEKSLSMIYQVLRDIGFYKKKLLAYRRNIQSVEDLLEALHDPGEDIIKKWQEFGQYMGRYEVFFEHFCVNYLFIHTDQIMSWTKLTLSVKLLLLELIAIRGVMFLYYLKNDGTFSETELKNVGSFYARMYEHGIVGTEKFIKENLENPWFSDSGFLIMLR